MEGRIQYREFTDAEGNRRQVSEIIISDMILLDNKRVDNGVPMQTADGSQPRSEENAGVDDGTIEDIVIPDELPEDKDEVDSAGETKKGKKEDSEEMPF